MLMENFTDMSFVFILVIGSIIALLFAYMRKTKKRRAK